MIRNLGLASACLAAGLCSPALGAATAELQGAALAALGAPSPLLAIDQNRATVVDRVVAQWGDALATANTGIGSTQLREMLLAMRADQLLAASLAGTLEGLRKVVAAAMATRSEAAPGARTKALGDVDRDLVYVPVTPCRLVETRGTYAAVYQAGGPFVPGEIRTYAVQGGNGVCLTQLPPDLHPGALQLQVYGMPTTSGSGDIEILPQGGTFGSTATLVYLGSNAFTSASTTAPVNLANNQISIQVRGGGANVAVDVVGYFRPATFDNIALPNSDSSLTGNVYKPEGWFMHNFGKNSTFLGVIAGNFTMSGSENTGVGTAALFANTTGEGNSAFGRNALRYNEQGTMNSAFGTHALLHNTSGSFNAAVGDIALYFNTSGDNNAAFGTHSLQNNTTGKENTAVGAYAMLGGDPHTGIANSAVGYQSLFSNKTGSVNSAVGYQSLYSNTTGSWNSALGHSALLANTTGNENTAIGLFAMHSNATGNENSALGVAALQANTAGHANTAVGYYALTATTGNFNIALGAGAGNNLATGDHNIYIGHRGFASEASTTRIGDSSYQQRTFVAGIRGTTTFLNDAVNVVVDGAGQLGTISSSRDAKDDIADMSDASAALMELRPVTFHYKSDHAPAGPRLQYGLIAEEVAAVYPGMVATRDGKPETVMYHYLAPMLLNEFQKQRRTIDTQAREIEALRGRYEAEIADLKRAVEVLMERTSRGSAAAARSGIQ